MWRLFASHRDYTDQFLAESSIFRVVDSFGIELLRPYREGRSWEQIGRQGLSNHRWIIGAKLGVVLNHLGLPVTWSCGAANLPDQAFQPLIKEFESEMLILSDQGFHAAHGDPSNLSVCKKGQQNYRMVVETLFALLSGVMHFQRQAHRNWDVLAAPIGYALAAFNTLVPWDGLPTDRDGFLRLSIAEFSL